MCCISYFRHTRSSLSSCQEWAACALQRLLNRSLQVSATINGQHTDVVCTSYSNVVFVLLTQIQKIGSLVRACRVRMLRSEMRRGETSQQQTRPPARTHARSALTRARLFSVALWESVQR
jgi:hypothetical protein